MPFLKFLEGGSLLIDSALLAPRGAAIISCEQYIFIKAAPLEQHSATQAELPAGLKTQVWALHIVKPKVLMISCNLHTTLK